jgi:hypothetical protein
MPISPAEVSSCPSELLEAAAEEPDLDLGRRHKAAETVGCVARLEGSYEISVGLSSRSSRPSKSKSTASLESKQSHPSTTSIDPVEIRELGEEGLRGDDVPEPGLLNSPGSGHSAE